MEDIYDKSFFKTKKFIEFYAGVKTVGSTPLKKIINFVCVNLVKVQ